MSTFAIMVRSRGNDAGSEFELCRVKTNPETIAEGLRAKRHKIVDPMTQLISYEPVYEHVEIRKLS